MGNDWYAYFIIFINPKPQIISKACCINEKNVLCTKSGSIDLKRRFSFVQSKHFVVGIETMQLWRLLMWTGCFVSIFSTIILCTYYIIKIMNMNNVPHTKKISVMEAARIWTKWYISIQSSSKLQHSKASQCFKNWITSESNNNNIWNAYKIEWSMQRTFQH